MSKKILCMALLSSIPMLGFAQLGTHTTPTGGNTPIAGGDAILTDDDSGNVNGTLLQAKADKSVAGYHHDEKNIRQNERIIDVEESQNADPYEARRINENKREDRWSTRSEVGKKVVTTVGQALTPDASVKQPVSDTVERVENKIKDEKADS